MVIKLKSRYGVDINKSVFESFETEEKAKDGSTK